MNDMGTANLDLMDDGHDAMAVAREEAEVLLEQLEEITAGLRGVLDGRAQPADARLIRSHIDAWGRLSVTGTADWDLLLSVVS